MFCNIDHRKISAMFGLEILLDEKDLYIYIGGHMSKCVGHYIQGHMSDIHPFWVFTSDVLYRWLMIRIYKRSCPLH